MYLRNCSSLWFGLFVRDVVKSLWSSTLDAGRFCAELASCFQAAFQATLEVDARHEGADGTPWSA
jgi:hypothetical protein